VFTSFNPRALGLDLPAREAIDLAASAGFGGVDLMVRDLVDSGDDPSALRRRMDDLGLRGGAWPLPVDWRSADAARFEHDLGRLPRYAEAAATLGLSRTGTWVLPECVDPMALPWPDAELVREYAGLLRVDPTFEPTLRASWANVFRFHESRLARIAEILAAHGIRLGLEVIGVESSRTGLGVPFIRRMGDPDFRSLIRCVNGRLPRASRRRPRAVGVLLDAFHLHAAGERAEDVTRGDIRDVVWVHVADLPAGFAGDRRAIRDGDRGLPGENGAVDLPGLLELLASRGYDGPVTAEPMAGCRALADLTARERAIAAASALRRVWPG
jgi:sugar phosphate isomerase/epimerase